MPKALLVMSKKITVIMMVILFAVSMALFISPGKIYGEELKILVTGAGGAKTVAMGSTLQMSAVVSPDDVPDKGVTWSISVILGAAEINEINGLLTATEEGKVLVNAISNFNSSVSGCLEITITKPVTSITVSGSAGAATVLNGGTLQMSAAVLPADATNQSISWSAANGTGSVEIDAASGILTGTGVGTITITATAKDGSAIFGTCLITVTAPAAAPTALAVNITGTAQAGQTLTGSYTYSDINGDPEVVSTFKWLASDAADGTYTEISGAASKTFMLTSYQAGKFIRFEVTPAASAGTLLTGTAVQSSATSVVLAAEEETAAPENIPGSSGTQASGPAAWADLPPLSSAVYEKTIPGFATLFYNTILGRAPDEDGLSGWAAGLTSGALTGADLVRGFIFSEENKVMTAGDTDEQFITSLYRLIFNRAPDAEGLKSWLANLNAGMTKEEVINYFTSSEEFISLCKEYGARP